MGETKNQPFQLSFNKFLHIDFQGSRVTSAGGLILEVRNTPRRSAELPKRAGFPPHRGHGDVSLAQEGAWRMIVRKGKVEIGNSASREQHSERSGDDGN